MPTQQQIQNTLLSAELALANLAVANFTQLSAGDWKLNWSPLRRYNRNIKALNYQYGIQDYTSSTTLQLYDCLNTLIGFDTTVNNLDPNFQTPTSPIIVVQAGAFGYVQSLNIVFAGVTGITLANWQTNYAAIYGQNPTIELWTTQGTVNQEDTQTQPIYNYSTPGDPTSVLQSIAWTYPIATSGYYVIKGTVATSTSGGGTIGGGTTYFYILPTSPGISIDGSGNFVYTDPRLIGKSGYYIYVTDLNQDLFDGTDLVSNAAGGSFTITNPAGFSLVGRIVVNLK